MLRLDAAQYAAELIRLLGTTVRFSREDGIFRTGRHMQKLKKL